MLYWICPECGHECSPTVRECPTCTAAVSVAAGPASDQQESAVRQEILALVQAFQTVPGVLLLADGSKTAECESYQNGADSSSASAAILTEEAPSVLAGEAIDSLVRPLVESAETPPPTEFTLAALESAPSAPISDCSALAQALEEEAEALAGAISPSFQAETAEEIGQALEQEAELILDSIARQIESEHSGIRAILASFQEQPQAFLLMPPRDILEAPAPPALEWIRMPRPTLAFAAPGDPDLDGLMTGPQAPTLAGPCLPPQLQNYMEELRTPRNGTRKRIGFPAWIVSVLIATVIILTAGSLLQYLTNNRDARADAITGSQSSSGSTTSVLREHPLARFVEVAGVRVTTGPNRRPQLQYIVINHSGQDLTGLAIRFAARSADDARNSTPLFSVLSKIPELGAYQSREIRTELDSSLRVSSFPDWQSLRTELEISGSQ